MINKILNILRSDLVKIFSLSALSTAIKMLTAFISIKVLAILVGPAGIALLGQLNNFSSILLTVSTGGINNGITKYTAQYANSNEELHPILRTSFWITLVLSITCSLILIIGSSFFARMILKDVHYQSIFIVFGLTIILYSLNNFLLSILNGFKEFRKFIGINIASSLVGLAFSLILVYSSGIYGALLSVVLYQSIIFFITLFIVTKSKWFKVKAFLGNFDKSVGSNFAQYSLMTLVGATTMPICQLLIRSYISRHLSIVDAGIWEGLNRISSMYLLIITTSLSVYYLPRLSELKARTEIRNEIIRTYKTIIPPVIIISIFIIVFRDLIIHLLFNDSFANMRQLFPFQLVGDLFKISSWILAYQFIAKAMIRTYVIMEISFSISFVLISIFLVKTIGITGATIAYAINYAWYFLAMIIIFRKLLFNRD